MSKTQKKLTKKQQKTYLEMERVLKDDVTYQKLMDKQTWYILNKGQVPGELVEEIFKYLSYKFPNRENMNEKI